MIMIICSLASPCLSCFIQSRSRILFNLTTIRDQVSQCLCQNSSCAKCFSPPANQPSYDLPGMQSRRTVHLNPIIFKSKVKCGTTHATRIPFFFHIPTYTKEEYITGPQLCFHQFIACNGSINRRTLTEKRTSAFCLCNFIRDAPETLLTRCAKAKRWICKSPVGKTERKIQGNCKKQQ